MKLVVCVGLVALALGACGGKSSVSAGGGGIGGTSGVILCGETLECAGTDVCIVVETPPSCPAKPDGQSCPTGTTESQCGGIGYACCCEPDPADEYACVTAGGCSDEVSCVCIGDVCPGDLWCEPVAGPDRELHCVEPPAA